MASQKRCVFLPCRACNAMSSVVGLAPPTRAAVECFVAFFFCVVCPEPVLASDRCPFPSNSVKTVRNTWLWCFSALAAVRVASRSAAARRNSRLPSAPCGPACTLHPLARLRTRSSHACRRKGEPARKTPFWSAFPMYACPEPVLVK